MSSCFCLLLSGLEWPRLRPSHKVCLPPCKCTARAKYSTHCFLWIYYVFQEGERLSCLTFSNNLQVCLTNLNSRIHAERLGQYSTVESTQKAATGLPNPAFSDIGIFRCLNAIAPVTDWSEPKEKSRMRRIRRNGIFKRKMCPESPCLTFEPTPGASSSPGLSQGCFLIGRPAAVGIRQAASLRG